MSHSENDKLTKPIPLRMATPEELRAKEIMSRFGFHKATLEGPNATAPQHAMLRRKFIEFATYLDKLLPDGRYKDLALTDLEAASMWSHKSIAELAPLGDDNDNRFGIEYVEDQPKCEKGPIACFGQLTRFKRSAFLQHIQGKPEDVWLCAAHSSTTANYRPFRGTDEQE